jgi:hypothetical protein
MSSTALKRPALLERMIISVGSLDIDLWIRMETNFNPTRIRDVWLCPELFGPWPQPRLLGAAAGAAGYDLRLLTGTEP